MERSQILAEREKTHGSFEKNADIWMKLGNAGHLSGLSIPQQLALTMIYLKIARLLCGQAHNKDHWEDIVGYAKLGIESCERDF